MISLVAAALLAYPGAVETPIGEGLAYFTTRDSMGQVAAHYAALWERDGYPTMIDGDLVDEGVVSAFFTRQGVVRSVVLRRHAGKTLAFAAQTNLRAREKPAPELPRPETALVSHAAAGARTSIAFGALPDVRAAVVKGWALRREAAANGALTLELERGGVRQAVTLRPLPDGLVAVAQTLVPR